MNNKWISIKDYLPGTKIKYCIIRLNNGDIKTTSVNMSKNNNFLKSFGALSKDVSDVCHVTHWMLLPEPPEKVK